MITIDFCDGNRFLAREARQLGRRQQNAAQSDIRATVCPESSELARMPPRHLRNTR
jgi:hypothetical protein